MGSLITYTNIDYDTRHEADVDPERLEPLVDIFAPQEEATLDPEQLEPLVDIFASQEESAIGDTSANADQTEVHTKKSIFAKLIELYSDPEIEKWIKEHPETYISAPEALETVGITIPLEMEVTIHRDILSSLEMLSKPEDFLALVREIKDRLSLDIQQLSLLQNPNKDQLKELKDYKQDLDLMNFIDTFTTGSDMRQHVSQIAETIERVFPPEVSPEAKPGIGSQITSSLQRNKDRISNDIIRRIFLERPGAQEFADLHEALTSQRATKLFTDPRFLAYVTFSTAFNVSLPNLAIPAFPAYLVQSGYPEYAVAYGIFETVASFVPIVPGLPGYIRLVTYGLIEGVATYAVSGWKRKNYTLADSIKHGIINAVDLGWMGIPLTSALRETGVKANLKTIKSLITAIDIGLPVKRLSKKYNL